MTASAATFVPEPQGSSGAEPRPGDRPGSRAAEGQGIAFELAMVHALTGEHCGRSAHLAVPDASADAAAAEQVPDSGGEPVRTVPAHAGRDREKDLEAADQRAEHVMKHVFFNVRTARRPVPTKVEPVPSGPTRVTDGPGRRASHVRSGAERATASVDTPAHPGPTAGGGRKGPAAPVVAVVGATQVADVLTGPAGGAMTRREPGRAEPVLAQPATAPTVAVAIDSTGSSTVSPAPSGLGERRRPGAVDVPPSVRPASSGEGRAWPGGPTRSEGALGAEIPGVQWAPQPGGRLERWVGESGALPAGSEDPRAATRAMKERVSGVAGRADAAVEPRLPSGWEKNGAGVVPARAGEAQALQSGESAGAGFVGLRRAEAESGSGTPAAQGGLAMKNTEEKVHSTDRREQTLPRSAKNGIASAEPAGSRPAVPVATGAVESAMRVPAPIQISDGVYVVDAFPRSEAAAIRETPAGMPAVESRVEHIRERIAQCVVELRRTQADAVTVVIKPDAETELSMIVHAREGRIEVEAQCRRGDAAGWTGTWQQLQQALAPQGIRLGALQDFTQANAGGGGDAGQAENGQPLEQEGQGQRREPRRPGAERAPIELKDHQLEPQPSAVTAGGRRRWESWA